MRRKRPLFIFTRLKSADRNQLTGDKYACLDGPVFYFDQIDKNWD